MGAPEEAFEKGCHIEIIPPKQDSEKLESDLKLFASKLERVMESGFTASITDNAMGLLAFQGSFTDSDYIRASYNEKSGKEIFAPEDEIAFEVLTYRQLNWLLERDGTYIILLGGSWCPNTQAVVKIINDSALANGVTVYTFDTKLDGGYAKRFWGYEKDLHIRDNSSEFAKLYVDMVLDHFHNIETEYTLESGNTIRYETEEGGILTANKLQVPYLMVYTKGLEDDYAHFVPISAYIEKMLTLDETRDDYVYAEENYKAYTDGVNAVFEAWAQLTGGSDVQTEK